jgi:hypothetical protein
MQGWPASPCTAWPSTAGKRNLRTRGDCKKRMAGLIDSARPWWHVQPSMANTTGGLILLAVSSTWGLDKL